MSAQPPSRLLTNGRVVPAPLNPATVISVQDWSNALVQLKAEAATGGAAAQIGDWVVAANQLFRTLRPHIEWVQMANSDLLWLPTSNDYLANSARDIVRLRTWIMSYGMPASIAIRLFGEHVLPPVDWPRVYQLLKSSTVATFAQAWQRQVNPQNRYTIYWDRTKQTMEELPMQDEILEPTSKKRDVLRLVKILRDGLNMPLELSAFFVFPSMRPRTNMHFIERILGRPFPSLPLAHGTTEGMFLNRPNTYVGPGQNTPVVVSEVLQNAGTTWLENQSTGLYIPVLRYIDDLLEDPERKERGAAHLIECGQFFDFSENFENFSKMKPASKECEDAFCGTFYYYDGDSPFLLRAERVLASRNKYTASWAIYNHLNLSARPDLKSKLLDAMDRFKKAEWEEAIRWKMISGFSSTAEIEAQMLDGSYFTRPDVLTVNPFLAPFEHSLDQPLCWAARYLNVEVIILTSMADVSEGGESSAKQAEIAGLVTEVMDIRSKLQSYGSLVVDKRFLSPYHPPRTQYNNPLVGLEYDYPNAFSLSTGPAAAAVGAVGATGVVARRRRQSLPSSAVYPPYAMVPFPQIARPVAVAPIVQGHMWTAAEERAYQQEWGGMVEEEEEDLYDEANETYEEQKAANDRFMTLASGLVARIGMGQRPIFATTLVGREGTIEYKFGTAGDFILNELEQRFPSTKPSTAPKYTNMFILKTVMLKPEYRRKGVVSMALQGVCLYANVDVILIESVTNKEWLNAMRASGKYWSMPGVDTNMYLKCAQ